MKKAIFFILGMGIASYCFGTLPTKVINRTIKEGWIGPDAKSSFTLTGEKGEDWITYAGNPSLYLPFAGEKATSFTVSDFPSVQHPFWIKKLKTIFYEATDNPWTTNQFKFKIYASDGQTLLYTSPDITAINYVEAGQSTEYNLGADSVEITSGDFYVSVEPGDASGGSPFCTVDQSPQGHSFYGLPGNWTDISDGELTHSAYLSWSAIDHDVCVLSIDRPTGGLRGEISSPVMVTVENLGLNTETFLLGGVITDKLGTPVYQDTQTVTGLVSGATQQLTFTDWTPLLYDEKYNVTFATYLVGDMVPANDTLSKISQTYEKGEIAYDDFGAENFWSLGTPNGANAAFAVRFTPYVSPPFYVTKGKVYVSSNTTLEYIGLFPGTTSAPDTGSPYQKISNPAASSPPGWIIVDFDTAQANIATSDDLWLVAKFAQNDTGPGFGADENPPIENRSYWTQDFGSWTLTTYDFMLRIIHTSGAGIEDVSITPDFKVNCSNPIQDYGVIAYEIPAKTLVSIELYDITGRSVTTLLKQVKTKGKHELKLNTKELASGIYFCKFAAGDFKKTKKLILVK